MNSTNSHVQQNAPKQKCKVQIELLMSKISRLRKRLVSCGFSTKEISDIIFFQFLKLPAINWQKMEQTSTFYQVKSSFKVDSTCAEMIMRLQKILPHLHSSQICSYLLSVLQQTATIYGFTLQQSSSDSNDSVQGVQTVHRVFGRRGRGNRAYNFGGNDDGQGSQGNHNHKHKQNKQKEAKGEQEKGEKGEKGDCEQVGNQEDFGRALGEEGVIGGSSLWKCEQFQENYEGNLLRGNQEHQTDEKCNKQKGTEKNDNFWGHKKVHVDPSIQNLMRQNQSNFLFGVQFMESYGSQRKQQRTLRQNRRENRREQYEEEHQEQNWCDVKRMPESQDSDN